jgi:hypothetical protein
MSTINIVVPMSYVRSNPLINKDIGEDKLAESLKIGRLPLTVSMGFNVIFCGRMKKYFWTTKIHLY